MALRVSAPTIWLACEAVDFRKSIQGLTALVVGHYGAQVDDGIYLFYNKAKNKVKLLATHRGGRVLIYKVLDKQRFTVKQTETGLLEMSEAQLTWLLAGLDWVSLSEHPEFSYPDFY